jgi:hypothetical protein
MTKDDVNQLLIRTHNSKSAAIARFVEADETDEPDWKDEAVAMLQAQIEELHLAIFQITGELPAAVIEGAVPPG